MDWNARSLQDALQINALWWSIYFILKTDQLSLLMAWIIIIVYGVHELSWNDQN